MRKFIALTLLALPMAASADYLDVWDFKLKEGCDFSTYLQIIKDFNQWASKFGYVAEIALPAYGSDLETLRSLGRTKNAADSGKVWDAWMAETGDPNSIAGKLSVRFDACQNTTSHTAFEIF